MNHRTTFARRTPLRHSDGLRAGRRSHRRSGRRGRLPPLTVDSPFGSFAGLGPRAWLLAMPWRRRPGPPPAVAGDTSPGVPTRGIGLLSGSQRHQPGALASRAGRPPIVGPGPGAGPPSWPTATADVMAPQPRRKPPAPARPPGRSAEVNPDASEGAPRSRRRIPSTPGTGGRDPARLPGGSGFIGRKPSARWSGVGLYRGPHRPAARLPGARSRPARFAMTIAREPRDRPQPITGALGRIAEAHAGPGPRPVVVAGAGTRRALAAAGAPAASADGAIYLARPPQPGPRTRELVAHEAAHLGHRPRRGRDRTPRLFGDLLGGAEERFAGLAGRVARRAAPLVDRVGGAEERFAGLAGRLTRRAAPLMDRVSGSPSGAIPAASLAGAAGLIPGALDQATQAGNLLRAASARAPGIPSPAAAAGMFESAVSGLEAEADAAVRSAGQAVSGAAADLAAPAAALSAPGEALAGAGRQAAGFVGNELSAGIDQVASAGQDVVSSISAVTGGGPVSALGGDEGEAEAALERTLEGLIADLERRLVREIDRRGGQYAGLF